MKELNWHSWRKKYKWPRNTWKDVQCLQVSRKCKQKSHCVFLSLPSEGPSWRIQIILKVGKSAGGTTSEYNHFEHQSRGASTNWEWKQQKAQLSYSFIFIQQVTFAYNSDRDAWIPVAVQFTTANVEHTQLLINTCRQWKCNVHTQCVTQSRRRRKLRYVPKNGWNWRTS